MREAGAVSCLGVKVFSNCRRIQKRTGVWLRGAALAWNSIPSTTKQNKTKKIEKS
jgi:hypothetical protein